jgi:acylphosphatase
VRPFAFVLLAPALFAIPGPHALAQPPARPEPRELWRQFPLEQAQAPESSPTNPTTAEEGRDRSFANARTVAIAVTIGLLLLLMVGLLAYVTRAQVALDREVVSRRLKAVVATNGQKFGVAFRTRIRRRSWTGAAARRLRGIAANVRKPTVPASAEATRSELSRLKEMLATYVARGPAERGDDEHAEKLKAKLEAQPPASGTGHYEVEILKAKLAGSREAGGLDEAEMLKAKLADNVAGKTRPRKAPTMGSKQRVSR